MPTNTCRICTRLAAPTTIAFSVVSQWFRVREGIATGCVTLGAAVGGIFFSLVLQALFQDFDWQVAILILSGVQCGLMALGNVLVRTNLKQRQPVKSWDLGGVRRLSRSPKFWFITYAIFGECRLPTRCVIPNACASCSQHTN